MNYSEDNLPKDLIDIEKAILKEVVVPWKSQVDNAQEAIILLYTVYMGRNLTPLEEAYIIARILEIINAIRVDGFMDDALFTAIELAHKWGLKDIAKDMQKKVDDLPVAVLSGNSQRAVEGMAERAQDSIRQVRDNLQKPGAVSNLESVLESISPITKNATRMQQATTWAVNNASNSAKSKVALKSGETMTWVSERDSCVHCAAYNGVDATKVGWPKGLTFGNKPLKYKGTLAHPPLHPNCRCDVMVGASEEYKLALKREAVRSILRGTKMPSESERVRLQAAERLLSKDPVVPESVKKYARDAIKRDGFTKKRK